MGALQTWEARAASQTEHRPKGHGNKELRSRGRPRSSTPQRSSLEGWAVHTERESKGKAEAIIAVQRWSARLFKHHLIQLCCVITLVPKREAEWNNKWRRPLVIQVESLKVGRWSGWLAVMNCKDIFMLFESPSISHVKQNCILLRQIIPYTHAHANHSHQTNSKRVWRTVQYVMPITKIFSGLIHWNQAF